MSSPWFQLVGPSHNVQIFGIKLLGVDAFNGRKLLFSAIFVTILLLFRWALVAAGTALRSRESKRVTFWTNQGISLVVFVLGLLGLLSIWFDNPTRLGTGIALVGTGLAFALQKVITAFAGYFVILRGKTFNVGDRIVMGGVRGDVVSLTFFQTVIMEMGEPPPVQPADPGMWVQSRQFSGRVVTVSNSKIFEEPVYNYTRDFPFLWEEMHLPVSYKDDRGKAEQIMLAAAQKYTVKITELAEPAVKALQEKFLLTRTDVEPRVYMRLTDNWVELNLRFLVADHDIRGVKDRMSREIIDNFDKAGIGIASGTYEIVGFPPVKVEMTGGTAK